MPRPNRGYHLKFHEPRNCYYVFWYREGRPKKRSTGTASLEDAQVFLKQMNVEQPQGVRDTPAPETGITYFIGPDEGPIKIGFTIGPVEQRMLALQVGSPVRLSIIASVAGPPKLERAYHRRFAAHRLHGEWFTRHPDILAEIARLQEQPA